MTHKLYHYLYGELDYRSDARIFPESAAPLLKHLNSWAPDFFEKSQEAVVDLEGCRELCTLWREKDISEEVGVCSMPLTPPPGATGAAHRIAVRSYFAYASGLRVSRTLHGMVFDESLWRDIEYNPFLLPHVVKSPVFFERSEKIDPPVVFDPSDQPDSFERLSEIVGQYGVPDSLPAELERLLGPDARLRLARETQQWRFELLLLCLPFSIRKDLRVATGPMGVYATYKDAFELAMASEKEHGQENDLLDGGPERVSPDVERIVDIVSKRDRASYDSFVREVARPAAMGFPRPLAEAVPALPSKFEDEKAKDADSGVPTTPSKTSGEKAVPDPKPGLRSKGERKKKPRKGLWRFTVAFASIVARHPKAAFVVVAVVLLFAGFQKARFAFYNGRVDDWVAAVESRAAEDPFVLLREADELLGDAPAFGPFRADDTVVSDRIDSLVAGISGLVAQSSSWDDMEKVHRLVCALDSAESLEHVGLSGRMPVDSQFSILFDKESDLVVRAGEKSLLERRRTLDRLAGLYETDSCERENPRMNALRRETVRMEAEKRLGELLTRWDPKIESGAALLDVRTFGREVQRFRSDFPDAKRREVRSLQVRFYLKYERQVRRVFIESFEKAKLPLDQKTLQRLNEACDEYAKAAGEIPAEFDISKIDVHKLSRRLASEPIISLRVRPEKGFRARIEVGVARGYRPYPTKCESASFEKKLSYGLADPPEACVRWQTGEKDPLQYDSIDIRSVASGRAARFDDGNFRVEGSVRWPDPNGFEK